VPGGQNKAKPDQAWPWKPGQKVPWKDVEKYKGAEDRPPWERR